MIWTDAIFGLGVGFLMDRNWISTVFFASEKIHFPEICQFFEMRFPVGDHAVEYRRKRFVGTYVGIKIPHDQRNVMSVGDIGPHYLAKFTSAKTVQAVMLQSNKLKTTFGFC